MKHIFSKILMLLFIFTPLMQYTHAQGDIFSTGSDAKIPYCGSGECGFQEGVEKVGEALKGTGVYVDESKTLATYVQEIIANNILVYLYLIMVIIIIYAGFVILTAGGEEDKVTKGKKIILFAVIGIIVIYLAGPITDFIFSMFNAN